MQGKQHESCLSCKIVSVSCFLGIGVYLIYQGRMQQKSKFIYYGLGTVSGCLGVGEIFDKSPFRTNSESIKKSD